LGQLRQLTALDLFNTDIPWLPPTESTLTALRSLGLGLNGWLCSCHHLAPLRHLTDLSRRKPSANCAGCRQLWAASQPYASSAL